MRKLMIAGLAAAAATPLLAQPAPPAPPVAPRAHIAPMADKVITRAEVDAKVRAHFERFDTNRDGFVAEEEMASMHGEKMEMGEHRMRDPSTAFDRIDSNKDGAISRDEFAKGRELRIEKRVVMGRDGAVHEGHAPMKMRMHRMGGGMMRGHLFKMADADNDGRVSLAEATAGAARHFDMMDSNHDGRITPDERRARRVMIKQVIEKKKAS